VRATAVVFVACMFWSAVPDLAFADAEKVISESYLIDARDPGIQLYVRNKRSESLKTFTPERTLLYVHGATYPAETAFDLALDGLSWMDYIAQHGWDVYLVDIRGYGGSTRPSEMNQLPDANPPIVDTEVAVRDVAAAVDHVLERRHLKRLNLLGWSWGTTIMASYAAQNNDKVDRLVLYAPLWLRTTPPATAAPSGKLGAYRSVTVEAAQKRWLTGVAPQKQGELIPAGWFEAWAQATFATDAVGNAQTPPVLRAPNGVLNDIVNFWSADKPLYDPAQIRAPVLLIHAEWDADTPAYMSQALFGKLANARWKRYVVIGEGTHSVIMEKNRMQLFREVQAFLEEAQP
jgi:pimeloyl-ACP methyl ester carboxylesterase